MMFEIFEVVGYGSKCICFIFIVVCGFEYYIGFVYEVEFIFDVINEKGEKVVFGLVGGGGCYDGFVLCFMGQLVLVMGFFIGVLCLMMVLKNFGKFGVDEVIVFVFVIVMDGDVEVMGCYQCFMQVLCNEGICVEMYQGNWKKFGNQLKYVDCCNCFIVII